MSYWILCNKGQYFMMFPFEKQQKMQRQIVKVNIFNRTSLSKNI